VARLIRRFIRGMIGAATEGSKLSVVSPLHATSPGLWPDAAAQLGKGGMPPVASLPVPPKAAAETAPVSAPSAAHAPPKQNKPNRGAKGGRIRVVASRVSPEEYAALGLKAREAGLSIGSYVRATGLGAPGPRARRSPPVNAELLAHAVAQLNKVGSNLNQIAHVLNAGHAVGAKEALAALAETRAAVACILKIVGRTDRHDSQGNDAQ
jgi:hypothetical protein